MKVSRRDLLAGAAGVVALGKTATAGTAQAPADSDQGARQAEPGARPARADRKPAAPACAASRRPARRIRISYGTITPADLHFERHHGGVPEIDPKSYSLLVHGMVERPMVFTLADLKRFPAVSRVHFLECSGNFGGRTTAGEITPQQLAPLTSNSEWTGVAAGHALPRGRRPSAGEMVSRRRAGCGAAHAQHSHRQGVRRCADRVRAERRGDPAGARLSGAPVPARAGKATRA